MIPSEPAGRYLLGGKYEQGCVKAYLQSPESHLEQLMTMKVREIEAASLSRSRFLHAIEDLRRTRESQLTNANAPRDIRRP